MNLATIRRRTARAIGLSASDSDDTTDIDSWANEAVEQFLKDTKLNVKTASMSVTASSGDYTLDSDILALADLWYEPANGVQEVLLEPVDSREIQRMRRLQVSADISPRYYALQGAHLLMLYPNPESSSDLLHISYVPRPTAALSATSDSPSDATRGNIPTEYHPVIEAYVKWKAGEAEEHRPSESGMKFQAEYERGIAKVRGDLNKKAGVFKAKKRWGRRPMWPITPGTDVRQ